jgi:hypothetical protein
MTTGMIGHSRARYRSSSITSSAGDSRMSSIALHPEQQCQAA